MDSHPTDHGQSTHLTGHRFICVHWNWSQMVPRSRAPGFVRLCTVRQSTYRAELTYSCPFNTGLSLHGGKTEDNKLTLVFSEATSIQVLQAPAFYKGSIMLAEGYRDYFSLDPSPLITIIIKLSPIKIYSSLKHLAC